MLVLHAWWGLDDDPRLLGRARPGGRAGEPPCRRPSPLRRRCRRARGSPVRNDARAVDRVGQATRSLLLPTVAGRPVPSPEAAAAARPACQPLWAPAGHLDGPHPRADPGAGPRRAACSATRSDRRTARSRMSSSPGAPGGTCARWRRSPTTSPPAAAPCRRSSRRRSPRSASGPGAGGRCGAHWSPARTPSERGRSRSPCRPPAWPRSRRVPRAPPPPQRSSPRPSTRSRTRPCGAGCRRPERSRPRSRPGWPRSRLPATGTSTPARAPSRPWPPNWRTGSGRWSAGPRGHGSAWSSRAPRSSPPPRSSPAPRSRPSSCGPSSSRSRRPRSRAWSPRRSRSGRAVAPRRRWRGSCRRRAPPCSPSWAGPAGSTPSSNGRCAPPGPRRSCSTRRRRTTSCARPLPCWPPPGSGSTCPAGGAGPPARLGARLQRPRPRRSRASSPGAGVGQEALVDYQWELALGDERLDAEELARLAELQQPLVRLRGQWVELDPRRLAAGLKLLAEPPSPALSVAELLGLAATLDEDPAGLPVLGVDADGWLGDLLSGQPSDRLEPVPAPAGFAGTLRPYQERGLAWLAFLDRVGLGGVLADDMGLGKTVQLLALLARDRRRERRRPGRRCWSARCRWSATGSARRRGSRRTCGCTSTTARTAPRGEEFDAARRGRRPRASPPTRVAARDVDGAARGRPGTGSCSTRRRRSRTRRPGRREAVRVAAGPAPDRGHRHAGGEPARRPVVDHGVRQPRPARQRRRRSSRASPSRSSGTATRTAADRLRTAHRPVRPAPRQDRPVDHRRPAGQAGDGGRLQPHRRAGRALPGGRRRHAARRSRRARASSGAAWCWPP